MSIVSLLLCIVVFSLGWSQDMREEKDRHERKERRSYRKLLFLFILFLCLFGFLLFAFLVDTLRYVTLRLPTNKPNVTSRQKQQQLLALRMVQNDLRDKVNEFSDINASLSGNVNKLTTECDGLKETEHKLDVMAKESGKSVDQLRDLVKENQVIIDEKKDLLQSDVVQAMIEVIMQSEGDESSEFSDREIQRLVLRMKNLPAIHVNEDLLKLKVKANRSLRAVIELVQDVENTDIPDEDRVFTINEEGYDPQ